VHEERLLKEKVRLICSGTTSALVSNTVLAGVSATYFWNNVNALYVGPWTTCFAFLLIARLFLYWIGRSDQALLSNAAWVRCYTVLIWMVSALWGCTVFFFGDTGDFQGTFLIITIVICVVAGGSYYSVPILPAVIGFILLGALPIAVFMLTRDSSAEKIIGVIALFLTLTLIRISIIINGWLMTSIERGLVNEYQSDQLEIALEKTSVAMGVQSDFLANISHEIRTPITGLLGMLQLLRANQEPEETARYLNVANNSARTLQVLMNDLLDMSKLQAGQFSIDRSPVNFITLVEESIDLLRPMAVEKGLILNLNTSFLTPYYFYVDDARMRQIIYNLVGNAIKFTESGSIVVTVRCRAISAGVFELECDVEDTGIGIPEDVSESLFERFTQVDSAQSRTRTGTGLGLAICRELLLLMDGTLSLKSTLGEGSIFSFSLPVKEAGVVEVEQNEKAVEGVLQDTPYHLLVADDNPTNLLIVEKMVKNLGWTVDTVDSGEKAIALFSDKEKHYDVILMDIQMPVLDGIETTRKIRALNAAGKHVPVIAVTANSYNDESEVLLAQKIDGYVPKPINAEQLHRVVSKAILKRMNEA